VDNESSPCGCPPAPAPAGLSLADAALKAGSPKQSAEAQHPFPAAISNGLAPPASVPQTPPGVVHAQVATTLSYEANTNAAEAANSPEPPSTTVLATSPPGADTATPPTPQHSRSVVHWIGHFFGKLFGRG
jgi:hypothetical protein